MTSFRFEMLWAACAAALVCAGCGPVVPATDPAASAVADPRDAFFQTLAGMCGQKLEGRTVYMIEPSEPFVDARLTMHVAACDERELRIPFLVGDDASRTWVITQTEQGLLFEHDHRHEDGTPEDVTDYGGYATADGSRYRQRFPAHAATARMIPEAATNVWTLELRPSEGVFVYDLERHGAPRFRAVFALSP
jgi:hypothetical protein